MCEAVGLKLNKKEEYDNVLPIVKSGFTVWNTAEIRVVA